LLEDVKEKDCPDPEAGIADIPAGEDTDQE
jgi:hypothetical protein